MPQEPRQQAQQGAGVTDDDLAALRPLEKAILWLEGAIFAFRYRLSPGRKLLVIAALVLAIVLMVIVGSGGSSTSDSGQQVASPTTAAAPPAKNPVTAALDAWYAGGGKAHLDAIGRDAKALASAYSTADRANVRKTCTSVQRDLEAAKAYHRLMPDGEAENYWLNALNVYGISASYCLGAVDRNDPELMMLAAADLDTANTHFGRLNARLKDIEETG